MGAFGTTQPSSTISHAHGGWCLAVWCMALLWYMGLVQEEWARWMKPTAEPNVMGRGMEEVNASNRRYTSKTLKRILRFNHFRFPSSCLSLSLFV